MPYIRTDVLLLLTYYYYYYYYFKVKGDTAMLSDSSHTLHTTPTEDYVRTLNKCKTINTYDN